MLIDAVNLSDLEKQKKENDFLFYLACLSTTLSPWRSMFRSLFSWHSLRYFSFLILARTLSLCPYHSPLSLFWFTIFIRLFHFFSQQSHIPFVRILKLYETRTHTPSERARDRAILVQCFLLCGTRKNCLCIKRRIRMWREKTKYKIPIT